MPLGSGALAGVNYELDRAMVAAELGFTQVSPNAMDGVSARDTAFAYLSIATNCALTLSRIAEELVLWSTQEFGLASIPESWTSGSSIMPQKRNPDAAELVRRRQRLSRTSAGSRGVAEGLPASQQGPARGQAVRLGTKEELDLCLQAVTMIEGLAVDERARGAAEGGYAAATDVADYLAGKGLPFREAHRVAGRLVAHLAAQGRPLAAARLEELQEISSLFDEGYYDVVDLERVVAAKVSPGGTAPGRIAEQLAIARSVLDRLAT
jgi:argininosuccinate lyase